MSKVVSRSVVLLLSVCFLFGVPALAQNWGNPTWSDEFTGPLGTPIDSTKWTYDTGILNVNNEVEYYCAPSTVVGGCLSSNPNAYIDGNGHLVIQALRLNNSTSPNSGSWTSARLKTEGLESFQYGRVESMMALPVGPGIWPAFWALGTNIDPPNAVGWPACGENDFMENVPASVPGGLGPTVIASTLHGPSTTQTDFNLGGKFTFTGGTDVTSMHTYGAIWSPFMVQFYVDEPTKVFFVGTASDMQSGQTWSFEHPFFLVLNLAIGGDGSWPGPTDATTPSPAIMTVDYVRIYKAAAVQAPTFGSAPSISVKAGATTGNSNSFSLNDAAGSGRVFLTCSTNAPKTTCQISSNDALNPNTLDFTNATSGTVSVSVLTTTNALLPPMTWHWPNANWMGFFVTLLTVAVGAAILNSLRRLRWVFTVAISFVLLVGILLGCSGGGSSTTPPPAGNGTTAGSYTVTVNAYTVSGTGASPDASTTIPLIVN
jgi:beta-glucanase (GH16 family)